MGEEAGTDLAERTLPDAPQEDEMKEVDFPIEVNRLHRRISLCVVRSLRRGVPGADNKQRPWWSRSENDRVGGTGRTREDVERIGRVGDVGWEGGDGQPDGGKGKQVVGLDEGTERAALSRSITHGRLHFPAIPTLQTPVPRGVSFLSLGAPMPIPGLG